MKPRPVSANRAAGRIRGLPILFTLSMVALAATGCTGGIGKGQGSNGATSVSTQAGRSGLPANLFSRWSPPEFATRGVDGERTRVLEASVAAANSLGYAVSRLDGAEGKIFAARPPVTTFEGARQDTLEITVRTLAPDVAQVAVTLRETVEMGSGDGRDVVHGGAAIVRDRARYDAFFSRLASILGTTE